MHFPFLEGQTETTHLNGIIQRGAAGRMTDVGFLEKEITDWLESPRRKMQVRGEEYYNGQQAILKAQRTVIGEGGKLQVAEYLPNCRIVDNQYAKAVDQKVNYLLGKPVTFDTDSKAYAQALGTVLNRSFFRVLRNVGEDSLNGGIGWLMPFYDEIGELRFRRFEPYEILPFWADAAHTKLDAAVHLFEAEEYQGQSKKIVQHVEVFAPHGASYFVRSGRTLIPEAPFHQAYVLFDGAPMNWSRIPLIPWKYNAKEIPLIVRTKSLQDGINTILSNFENGMLEDPHNTILVVVNAEGTKTGEFRRNLAQYGVVHVRDDGQRPSGDVRTLTVEVNAENYKTVLSVFKKAFIENARSFDAKDDRLGNDPNEMNLRSMYSDIDLDANGMETEYQAAFEELLWFLNAHLANTGYGNFEGIPVEIVFNRDVMMNTTEQITQVRDSVGIVSNQTLLSHHPFVKNVDREMEALEQEKAEAMQEAMEYSGAFGSKTAGMAEAGHEER